MPSHSNEYTVNRVLGSQRRRIVIYIYRAAQQQLFCFFFFLPVLRHSFNKEVNMISKEIMEGKQREAIRLP